MKKILNKYFFGKSKKKKTFIVCVIKEDEILNREVKMKKGNFKSVMKASMVFLALLIGMIQSVSAEDKLGNCPYSINEIVSARDSVAKHARWLFNSPMDWDAALYLEIALAKLNEIESISGCESARNIFSNAKLKATQAKQHQEFYANSIKKGLESVAEMMRSN